MLASQQPYTAGVDDDKVLASVGNMLFLVVSHVLAYWAGTTLVVCAMNVAVRRIERNIRNFVPSPATAAHMSFTEINEFY